MFPNSEAQSIIIHFVNDRINPVIEIDPMEPLFGQVYERTFFQKVDKHVHGCGVDRIIEEKELLNQ
jgi:hypothetical protein